MIRLKDVAKYYYKNGMITRGFSKLSVEFKMGEFVVITGESGSGKSTLLNVISGLDSYEEGEMYINGKETSHYSEEDYEKYRKEYISNIFQNFNLVNSYTVYQNVELILLLNGHKRKNVKMKVLDLIKSVDLYKYRNTKVSKLSGGQKQRVAIARALAQNTPIIIADEPTGNLDKRSSESVLKTLSELSKDKLVIVVTHNYEDLEKYATRKITMFDGKITEDKVIKKVDENENLKINNNNNKNITLANQLRIALRNTFNIIPKFLLLLAVFLFMIIAIVSETSSFKLSKFNAEITGYNPFLENRERERVIISKKDKSIITNEDYDFIKSLSNVNYVVKNDLELDSVINIYSETTYFSGNIFSADESLDLDYGVMPQNDDEIVIVGSEDNYYLKTPQSLIGVNYDLVLNYGNLVNSKLKVVGIKIADVNNDEYSIDNVKIYGTENLVKSVNEQILKNYGTVEEVINGTSVFFKIEPLNEVKEGYIYATDALNNYATNGNALNNDVKIIYNNLYYNSELDLKVSKVLTKNNLKNIIGKIYDENDNAYIFLNPNDYKKIIKEDNYQSSIFVNDIKKIDETKKILEDAGYNVYPIAEMLGGQDTFGYFLNIVNVIVTIVLLIVMLFISYLIIKVILKSRHTYFSTLRILGASKKLSKNLLFMELFTIFNIAFIMVITLVVLIEKDVILFSGLKEMLSFMKISDYALVYLLILFMTYLIQVRFTKYLFKQSAITTFNKEAL
jgi:putative ABC transport system permease protein